MKARSFGSLDWVVEEQERVALPPTHTWQFTTISSYHMKFKSEDHLYNGTDSIFNIEQAITPILNPIDLPFIWKNSQTNLAFRKLQYVCMCNISRIWSNMDFFAYKFRAVPNTMTMHFTYFDWINVAFTSNIPILRLTFEFSCFTTEGRTIFWGELAWDLEKALSRSHDSLVRNAFQTWFSDMWIHLFRV